MKILKAPEGLMAAPHHQSSLAFHGIMALEACTHVKGKKGCNRGTCTYIRKTGKRKFIATSIDAFTAWQKHLAILPGEDGKI